jgi:hypothetical protein
MSIKPTTGQIKPDSDRAAWWRTVCGDLEVPLVSPLAKLLNVQGAEDRFYEIDLARLTAEQLELVYQHVAERFKADIAEVRAELGEVKVLPIRASEIDHVVFDARLVI